MKSKKKFLILATSLSLSFIGQAWINDKLQKPKIKVSKQNSAFNFDAHFLKFFHLGNRRLLSSGLWIKTLIESDIDHYKGDPLNNWMYLRFHTILSLDPWFLEGYRFGSQYLSIVKDDLDGASEIYEKGLTEYPNDYELNFNAGFHYTYELGQLEKGMPYFEKLIHHPRAPFFLGSLVARIKSSLGDLQTAYQLVFQKYKMISPKSPLYKTYQDRLYSIKAEIDLNCLNQNKSNCSLSDFNGEKYKYNLKTQKYMAAREWKKFFLKNKKTRQ